MKKSDGKKVKSILFRMNITGQGVVNNDSKEQRFALNRMKMNGGIYDNVIFAKKNFYGVEGDYRSKIKISSDCLRNAIFRGSAVAQTPNIQHDPAVLSSFIASPTSMMRGYLFADKDETVKRKGAVSIVDAEQINDAVPYLETFSKSGDRSIESDEAGNSFFKKETIGHVEYSSRGVIDLRQLQFLSMDILFDRLALNADAFGEFEQFMKLRMPSFKSKPAYYIMNGSIVDIPEYGIRFSNDDVISMVKEFLYNALNMNISKGTAYAATSSLEFKLVYDNIEDTFSSNDGWIAATSDSIKDLSFDMEDFYIEHDMEKSKAKREQLEAARKLYAKENSDKKAEKKAAKASAKKGGKKNEQTSEE